MGCDGCMRRAVLCENRSCGGSVSVQTMGRGLGSSLQESLLLISPSTSLPSLFVLVELSQASLTPTHNLPLSSLLLFHAITSPCLCDAFVSCICQSPGRGMLLAASSHLLFWHSHAGSLWVGLSKQGS